MSPGSSFQCAVARIVPSTVQARKKFQFLDELASSIRERGLIEPIVVRSAGNNFELIAGERRWRAAQLAGVAEVTVVLREATDQESFELGLIENVQRESLNPIELACALQKLQEQYGYTQDDIAELIGKDRSTVANSIRLLKLPAPVQELLIDGRLDEGHARALLGVDDVLIEVLALRVSAEGLSVRATEQIAREARGYVPPPVVHRGKRQQETDGVYPQIVQEITRAQGFSSESSIELYELLETIERSGSWQRGGHGQFEEFLAKNWPNSLGLHRYRSVIGAIQLYGAELVRRVGAEAAHCLLDRALIDDEMKRAEFVRDLRIHLKTFGAAPAVAEIRRLVKHHAGEVQGSQTAARATATRERDAEITGLRAELKAAKTEIRSLTLQLERALAEKSEALHRSVVLSKELEALMKL